jgi:hypothetical protein
VKIEDRKDTGFEPQHVSGDCADLGFTDYLDTRPETGLTRMLLNLALEPANPFKPDGSRNFRKGFGLVTVFSAAFIAWLVWFNVIR